MKLTPEEDNFFQMICAVSTKDSNTVRDVLSAILTSMLLTIYNQYNEDLKKQIKDNTIEFLIPFICKLRVDYKDHVVGKGKAVNVNLSALPSSVLINEIANIIDDKDLDLIKNIQKGISMKINNILEIDENEPSCLG